MKTINRGWLKRKIQKGLVQARVDGYYTDDYSWDSAANFGRTGWLPARIRPEGENQLPDGFIYFNPSDFRGYGHAWRDANGNIALTFGYRDYTLRGI